MKRISFLLLIISSAAFSQDYFPLRVGNRWTYCSSSDTVYKRIYSILDSTSLGDKKYFVYGLNNGYNDTIRKDIYGRIWRLVGGKDLLWLDFTRNDSDVYDYGPTDTFMAKVTVRRNLSIKAYSGNYASCADFFFDIPSIIDDEIGFTFAPSVGLVKKYGAWSDDLLFSAVVNNVPVNISNGLQGAPGAISLSQNYPNPFNPVTMISYQLKVKSYVTIAVFDLLGREVARLVNQERSPGIYSVQWDATRYSNGVYFYQLRAGDFVETKKMALMK